MSALQKAVIGKCFVGAYRLAVIAFACGVFWLRSTFATREELLKTSERIGRIETILQVMAEQNLVNNRQDEVLRDHEARLRDLERKR